MNRIVCIVFLAVSATAFSVRENEFVESPRLGSGEELLDSVISDCFNAVSATGCMKGKVLSYLDTKLGIRAESARAFDEKNIDKVIFDRFGRVLNTNEFRIRLPEFLFQSAEVSYRADRGMDVEFPDEGMTSANGEARGLLKKKLLLPVLLLLKLKMKALMPLLVTLVGIKAIKALVLSKLAITLVVGFLIFQLMKKGGMPMPMSMAPTEPPAPVYGAPAPSNSYGAPASTPAAPADSYSPHWEPSSSGPYARVWDPSQLAYSSYYSGSSSGSSGSSSVNTYPSISSTSSVSSNSGSDVRY